METIYGIDLGGTQVKARAFDRAGNILASDKRLLGSWREGPERLRASLEALREACGREPDGLGITAPGIADRAETRILSLPGDKIAIEGLVWKDYLGFAGPVRVLNDAHAALMGELWQGAAQGLEHAVLLTLGTGVGGAILAEGRLMQGRSARAGCIGHTCLDPDGEPGICGMPGSLEDFIGNQTVKARSHGRFETTHELVAAAEAGDAAAAAVWRRSVYVLACAVGSLVNILDPEAVILGGGIALAGEALFKTLQEELDKVEWRPTGQAVELRRTRLGEWSGAYGAAYRVIEQAGG